MRFIAIETTIAIFVAMKFIARSWRAVICIYSMPSRTGPSRYSRRAALARLSFWRMTFPRRRMLKGSSLRSLLSASN
jgi:hypothetical protein